MSFVFSLTPLGKGQCTSGKILLTILVLVAFSSVSSLPSKGAECPNCSGQYMKIVDPSTGKCIRCWPCLECADGQGSSVKCGATVPEGTKIHCVLCVNGANFSDSFGTDQCQPCGVCAGEHEHVLNKCTYESDVKCDCKAGFYRNKTNDKCLPCSSCPSCLRDKDILSNCQKDGGKQQMARSPTTMYSTSLVSSLVTSCHSHYATSMSLPPGLTTTRVLVPTRTRQISSTSTSVMTPTSTLRVQVPEINLMDYHTHETSSKKTEIIISVSLIICVCLLTGVLLWLLYHALKNSRTHRINNNLRPVSYSELSQGDNEDSKQGNNEETNKSNLTGDSATQDGRVITDDHREYSTPVIGNPSSLADELRNCICQGNNQPCDLPEDTQDGSVIAPKDGTVVPSDNLDALGNMRNKTASGNHTAVNVFVNIHDLSQKQRATAAVSSSADFTSTSCGNKLVSPASSSGMSVPVNWGTICALNPIAAPAAQLTEGNRGYATHITLVPLPVIYEMCRLLDLDRDTIDGNDYTMLGSELGLDSITVLNLKQKHNSPSFALLMKVFPALPNSGTLGHLIPLLEKMGRHDVIQVIDRWVGNQK